MELSGFLTPIDGSPPSGIDLRNEAAFHTIERALDPAARTVRAPSKPGEPPSSANVDWTTLLEQSGELAAKGRDLRLLVIVTRALTNLDGLAGLTAGLDLLTQNITAFWDTLHPLLRERDTPKEAALRRINALKQLENDDNGLLGDLEMNAIMSPRGIGMITGQDLVDAARTEFEAMSEAPSGLSGAEKEALRAAHETNQTRVIAACRAVAAEDAEHAAALKTGVVSALAGMEALCVAFSTAAGLENGTGLIFPELQQFLQRAQSILEAEMTENAASAPAPVSASPTATAAPSAEPAAAASVPGVVRSRTDVERCLTQIIDFYAQTEPSSPIPHLAERMRRMVHMNFIELMEEIAPSGMKEFRNAAGVADGKSK